MTLVAAIATRLTDAVEWRAKIIEEKEKRKMEDEKNLIPLKRYDELVKKEHLLELMQKGVILNTEESEKPEEPKEQ